MIGENANERKGKKAKAITSSPSQGNSLRYLFL